MNLAIKLFLFAGILWQQQFVSSSAPTNILFILADDLGYGDIQNYANPNTAGRGRIMTPNLNIMAEEGIKFTNFYAGDTVCAPSRCSLMTGLHSGHSRIRGNADVPLRPFPEDVTVAEMLKRYSPLNYTTGIIGKWGLGLQNTTGTPNKKGFDYFFGYLSQNVAHDYYPATGLWRNDKPFPIPANSNRTPAVYSDDLFTSEALNFLDVHGRETNPFFLYLAYTIPHAGGIGTEDETGCPVPSDYPYSNKTEWPTVERDFAAMITRMDRDIGTIFAKLKSLGIDENTIVFFTSDNGAHNEGGHNYQFFNSSGYLRGFKRSMYDGGIRSPLIVRWPGVVPTAVHDDASVFSFWDMMPTFANIAKVPADQVPTPIDGISQLDTIIGKPKVAPHYLYWEFCCDGQFRHAIRVGDLKGVKFGLDAKMQLFNLSADVGEQHDLSLLQPSVVAKFEALMKAAHTESKEFPSNPCKAGLC